MKASWYNRAIMYLEVARIDMDYADECPEMEESVPDYDIIFEFVMDNKNRFFIDTEYPVEYYQIKGDWVSGDGIIDMYKDGDTYRVYRRV